MTLNALGDIYDIDTDKKIAGALDENGLLFDDETAYFEAAAKIQNMITVVPNVINFFMNTLRITEIWTTTY